MRVTSNQYMTWLDAVGGWANSPFDLSALKDAFAQAGIELPEQLLDFTPPAETAPVEAPAVDEPVEQVAEAATELVAASDSEDAPAAEVVDTAPVATSVDAAPQLAPAPEAAFELAASAAQPEMHAEAAASSGLRWAPPTLKAGYTVIDLNKTGSQTYWEFAPDQDVMFIASDTVRTSHRLQTSGGNNIVLVGGEYVPTSKGTATLYFTNVHGSVYVEGVHVNNKNVAQDGIAVYGASGKAPTVTIQNSLIENVNGTRGGTHGDVFQTHGPVGDIRMYNVTGSTNYQGLFIAPQAPTKSATLENVNMKYIPGGDSTTYQYWFLDDASEKPFPISLKNVYTTERSGQRAESASVWPKAGLGGIGAVRNGDDISWPGLPYEGKITVGAPPSGDFVKAADVGLSYDGSVDSAPLEPMPTDPVPTDPIPMDPAPTNPAPADGAAPNNWIAGTDANNTLTGTDKNDQISGRGGDDTMSGGKGDDTYIVGQAGDKVIEKAGEGIDTVVSHISAYTLPDNVENLKLEGTGNSSGTGNGMANKITGNAGDNRLDGKGGNDFLTGGAGNDSFVIAKGQGNDTIADFTKGDKVELSGFSFKDFGALKAALSQKGADVAINLGDGQTLTLRNAKVDALTGDDFGFGGGSTTPPATPPAGDASFFSLPATGNSTNWIRGGDGNDTLTGTAANDFINGRGGADTMIGGKGDDSYIVNLATDKVVEKAGEGTDTVTSWAKSYNLPANVENLYIESWGGAGVGNDGNNLIIGRGGDNVLSGMGGNDILIGGVGADRLTGGAGKDMFVIHSMNEKGDVITDYKPGEDMLDLRGLVSASQLAKDSAIEHYITLVQQGANTAVKVDPTGGGQGEVVVTLEGLQPAELADAMHNWL